YVCELAHHRLLLSVAEDVDRAGTVVDTEDAAARHMGQRNLSIENLQCPSLFRELPIRLADLRDAGCSDRMASGQQPPAGADSYASVTIELSVGNGGVRLATIGDAQRLGMQQLGDGKRVMEFDQIEIVGPETRLRIGRARRPLGDLGPRHVAIARRG